MLAVNALNASSDMFLMMELAEWSVTNAKLGMLFLVIVPHAMMVMPLLMEHAQSEVVKNLLKNPQKNQLKNPMRLKDATLMLLMEAVQLANIEELELAEVNVEELVTNVTLGMLQMVLVLLAIVDIHFLMANVYFDTLLSLNFLNSIVFIFKLYPKNFY